jgi:hypothetical protein
MKKIVEISAKKCYNASSSHDWYGKIKFTVVATNTLTLPLGLTHPLIFCWNFISFLLIGLYWPLEYNSHLRSAKHLSIKSGFHTMSILHTPWSRILLEKLTCSQLVKKFPSFYRTQRFITTLTSACHLFISWARSIQSMSPPIPLPEDPS